MGSLDHFYAAHSALINFMGINALLALSLFFTLSAGQLSLANAAFMGIGAYTAALLTVKADAPFLLALAGGALLPAIVAVPLGLPILRLRGVFLAIATIAFGEVARIVALNLEITGGALGLSGIPAKTELWQIALALVGVLFLLWRVRDSKMGKAFVAIREDESAARTMGIDTVYYKLVAFVLGAAVAGLAGGLAAHFLFFISPNDYGFARAVDILVYAIVGGVASFVGPVFGAWLITVIPEFIRNVRPFGVQPGPAALFVNGAILLLVMLFMPNGLVSLASRGRRGLATMKWRRRVDAAET
jgi:branched-chain amino acid transport system permease protein